MNKKRWLIIAIALFLIIGTGSFVFANSSESSLNGKGNTGSNSSQSKQTNESFSTEEDNNDQMQNETNLDLIENGINEENLLVNESAIPNTMVNEGNGIVTNNENTNTVNANINQNNNSNNSSSVIGGNNNSQNSTNNNNNNNNNGNHGSSNNNNGSSNGSSNNGSNNPGVPVIPDVVNPNPDVPNQGEETPTNGFQFANLKSFYENKIEITDENFVSINIRNWTKNTESGPITDRIITLDGCDTYTFTVCYRNMSTCPSYTMFHVCSVS